MIAILICILFATLFLLKRSRDPKPNMPPLVPYKIPIIGHTFSYLTNCEEFLRQCKEEYGEIFALYIFGQEEVFVGKEYSQEVITKNDSFDIKQALRRLFPVDDIFKNSIGFKPLREYIINKLKLYTERVQESLYMAIEKNLGDDNERKVIRNSYDLLTKIISTPIANVFVGEEVAEFDDIITTFSEFTKDTAIFFKIPPLLDFIYPGLQSYVNRIPVRLGLFNPSVKHRHVLVQHLKNQVNKRLQEKQKYGESWKRPNDLLQDLMEEESFDPNNINYVALAETMCLYIFISVHSTSLTCANVLMDLASRPEYMQELHEEQLEIHKKADKNGILPFESLDEMIKLDSFVRESLRLTGNMTQLSRFVSKDYTFSNGLEVQKGLKVTVYVDDILRNESLQGPNPKSFEPFRHVDKNAIATKIGKNYVVFGGGKHACPGRFFAINEIKFFMHYIILKYNFRTESGKIEEKLRFGPVTLPSESGIIFEKRN